MALRSLEPTANEIQAAWRPRQTPRQETKPIPTAPARQDPLAIKVYIPSEKKVRKAFEALAESNSASPSLWRPSARLASRPAAPLLETDLQLENTPPFHVTVKREADGALRLRLNDNSESFVLPGDFTRVTAEVYPISNLSTGVGPEAHLFCLRDSLTGQIAVFLISVSGAKSGEKASVILSPLLRAEERKDSARFIDATGKQILVFWAHSEDSVQRPVIRGTDLQPLRSGNDDGKDHSRVFVDIDRSGGRATLSLHSPDQNQPQTLEGQHIELGSNGNWVLRTGATTQTLIIPSQDGAEYTIREETIKRDEAK